MLLIAQAGSRTQEFTGLAERVGIPTALLFGLAVFAGGVFLLLLRWFMRRADRDAARREQVFTGTLERALAANVAAIRQHSSVIRRLTSVVLATARNGHSPEAADRVLAQLWEMERACTTCPLQAIPEEEREAVVARLRACMAKGTCGTEENP